MNTNAKKSELGGARLKFLLVAAIIFAVAFGKAPDWVRDQLVKSSVDYGIPQNAIITPTQQDNRMQVRVQFTQPVEFPGFVYDYEFDHTAKSSTFLTIR